MPDYLNDFPEFNSYMGIKEKDPIEKRYKILERKAAEMYNRFIDLESDLKDLCYELEHESSSLNETFRRWNSYSKFIKDITKRFPKWYLGTKRSVKP